MIIVYIIFSFLIGAGVFLNKKRKINTMLVSAFLILQWAFTIYTYYNQNIGTAVYFRSDSLAILMLLTLSIISIPALFHSYEYINKEKENAGTRSVYYTSMIIMITALSAAYLSSHIAVTWIFVEITTLSASALIYHRRNSGSLEATWKYVFVSSVSLTLVFIGILFLSIALRSDGDDALYYDTLLRNASLLDPFWLKLAFLFIFSGYTVKMGLVPMYTAGIDAKDKAPAPAAALFSSVLMNVGFIGVFRFYEVMTHSSLHSWTNKVVMTSGLLSVFIAAVYMLKVKNIKRMLAYSSMEHLGIVMIGIAAGGVGYYAAILHIILHAFAKSTMFFQIGQVYNIYKSKNIYNVGSYFKYNLPGAILLLLAFICITAMPPSGLFFSELMIFLALFKSHHIVILIPLLILLTTIIWAFGSNMFKLLFIPPVDFDETKIDEIRPLETLSQFALIGLVIYLGINPPEEFVALIRDSVKNLL